MENLNDNFVIRIMSELSSPNVRVFDLGHELFEGIPQSDQHPRYQHFIPRRHGDILRGDGSSGANDLIITGTHVGTHIDALSHISSSNNLHNGISVPSVQTQKGFTSHGVEQIPPIVVKGILLDIPKVLGQKSCEPGYAISPTDLEATISKFNLTVDPDSAVLIRTGWGSYFSDPLQFNGEKAGSPGISDESAHWLVDKKVQYVGCDTVSLDPLKLDNKSYGLPAHKTLIFEHGIYIMEALDLEVLSSNSCYEFLFVALPLKLRGATGSPIRPIAISSIN